MECRTVKDQREQPKGKSIKRTALEWGVHLATAMAVALFINNFIIVNASVTSGSMENTVMTGSRVFGSRLAYLSREPERFDIVAFMLSDGGEEKRFFKRIIGLPEETVEIRAGKVYINDAEKPLTEPFIRDIPSGDYGPFQVPEDHYFMLGDNRNHSYDSRYWDNPYIERSRILGKAYLEYYPEIKV
ncbi:signal peptidase I, partial [Ruminococcaceae bacterium OttesenSCG-928-L11]|nr:signal peptidase I [Ruminococcaceae bacterium OttesenSCG-928-L11]